MRVISINIISYDLTSSIFVTMYTNKNVVRADRCVPTSLQKIFQQNMLFMLWNAYMFVKLIVRHAILSQKGNFWLRVYVTLRVFIDMESCGELIIKINT